MSDVSMPAWSLCPFRSPVELPEESALHLAGKPKATRQALGPCLFAGCGLFKGTAIKDGKITDGMCSIRFIAEAMNSLAGSADQLLKLAAPAAKG